MTASKIMPRASLLAALAFTAFTAPAPAGDTGTASPAAEPFKAPGVVTVAYRDRRVATDAAGVLRQGGLATAGAVRWLPTPTGAGDLLAGAL